MGNDKIRPRADPKPLNRSTQNLKQVITFARRPPVQNFVQIRPLGLLGKWVKYNENFSPIYIPFLLTYLQVRLPDGFSFFTRDGSDKKYMYKIFLVKYFLTFVKNLHNFIAPPLVDR